MCFFFCVCFVFRLVFVFFVFALCFVVVFCHDTLSLFLFGFVSCSFSCLRTVVSTVLLVLHCSGHLFCTTIGYAIVGWCTDVSDWSSDGSKNCDRIDPAKGKPEHR